MRCMQKICSECNKWFDRENLGQVIKAYFTYWINNINMSWPLDDSKSWLLAMVKTQHY